ncbi:MAG: hypothetical protein ACFFBD_15385 [Candidatus Hodarchaeota archaeon]
MMRLYDILYENEVVRTFILGGSFASLALLLEIILVLWDNDFREIEFISFVFTQVPFIESFEPLTLPSYFEPVLCLVHIILWAVFFFFFFVTYANLRDLINSPAGYVDLAVIIGVITLISALASNIETNGLFVGIGFFFVSLVESFYIQAALRELEE